MRSAEWRQDEVQRPDPPAVASIVVPAHDEEAGLAGLLDRLIDDSADFDIVVVANGCSDRTANVARGFGSRVRVIETPVASKRHALRLGDEAATGFPRLYIDADVVIDLIAGLQL